jgi:putative flippase GtrA
MGISVSQSAALRCKPAILMKTFDLLIANCVALGRQLSLFTLVGALGTLAHYLLLVILVELVGINAVIASTVGALLGATINYALNYRFTFNSRTSHRIALPKFLAVATVGFLINALLMWVAVNFTIIHYVLGQVIATSLVLLWNFFVNRYWTFQEVQNDPTK